jgi:hypothetical protein
MDQRCLGCNVIRLATAAGDYCHACLREIEAYSQGGERLPRRPSGEGYQVVDTWMGRREWTHYRERSLCYGKRKPRIYVRPSDG